MAWDSTRKVPWRRILMFEGLYLGLFVAFLLITRPEKMSSAISSILFAAAVTLLVLVALVKFGYQPSWLRSREEQAEVRAQKIAARQEAKAAKSGKTSPSQQQQRYVPTPTKRTTTGPSQHKRRTTKTRKR